jgi:hypothetical protein
MPRSLHQILFSVDHMKKNGKDRNVAPMGEIRSEYNIFIRMSRIKYSYIKQF